MVLSLEGKKELPELNSVHSIPYPSLLIALYKSSFCTMLLSGLFSLFKLVLYFQKNALQYDITMAMLVGHSVGPPLWSSLKKFNNCLLDFSEIWDTYTWSQKWNPGNFGDPLTFYIDRYRYVNPW